MTETFAEFCMDLIQSCPCGQPYRIVLFPDIPYLSLLYPAFRLLLLRSGAKKDKILPAARQAQTGMVTHKSSNVVPHPESRHFYRDFRMHASLSTDSAYKKMM
jgi:hypothetical protein